MNRPTVIEGNESLALERIAFFSDAVIAIALTLLAIDLRLPERPALDECRLPDAIGDLGPALLRFL